MKKYEDLVTLLKRVQAMPGHVLDVSEDAICDYQDMIGHSSQEQLKDLANGTCKETFYRVYGYAYGTTEAIKFYMQNSDKVYQILLERDGLKCDLEEQKEKTEKAKKEAEKNAELMCKARDQWEKEAHRAADLEKEIETMKEEITKLKAKLYDMIAEKEK